jgi:hypothetical protein
MKRVYCFATLFISLVVSCRTARYSSCVITPETLSALRLLRAREWRGTTPEDVATGWPAPITWGAQATGAEPCAGTVTFSNLQSVADNECRCCDTFGFSDVRRNNTCTRDLSSVTIVRSVGDEVRAREIARELLMSISGEPADIHLPITTVTQQLSPTQLQTCVVEIVNVGGEWRVRLVTYRPDAEER